MQKDFERRLDDLDDWKDALLGSLAIESPERLAFRPDGKGWCALDVVQHLVLVEESVVGYARKKLQGPPQPVPVLDRAKLALLVLILRSPVRFRAPTPVVIPAETVPLGDLTVRWGKVREDLREILGSLPDERRKALFFRHPIGGALDPHGTLDFVHEHAEHHDAQIRRTWRVPGCPK
jgi:hypothetical protein